MNPRLYSLFLYELERLEKKYCNACQFYECEIIPADTKHTCYNNNKDSVNKYRYTNLAIFCLQFSGEIDNEQSHEIRDWLRSNNIQFEPP